MADDKKIPGKNVQQMDQNSEEKRILSIEEKRALRLKTFKRLYGFDLSSNNVYLIFEIALDSKKHKYIPGVVYLKGKGTLVGVTNSRTDAQKRVKELEKNMQDSVLSRLREYKVVKLSTGLRVNLLNEGLRSVK